MALPQNLFFAPGDYRIIVNVKYWTHPLADPKNPPNDYHTMTTTADVPVEAPYFVLLFGAAVGGLIAFLIVPREIKIVTPNLGFAEWLKTTKARWLVPLGSWLRGCLGAMLLSVLTTIVLSRTNESQSLSA
jgi:hypothetical protein